MEQLVGFAETRTQNGLEVHTRANAALVGLLGACNFTQSFSVA